MRGPLWGSSIVWILALAALGVYLFVQAPPPLAATPASRASTFPIRAVFALLEYESNTARTLWTEEIVGRGLTVGLAFGERWEEVGAHEGPLPALFLRETARNLERTTTGLRLFLGSRAPINRANQLAGEQLTALAALEAHGTPQFFFEPNARAHTAMFADRAAVQACVTCHNEHPDSPRRDWKVGDVMGATTWMYTDEYVSHEQALALIAALRASIRATYARYLAQTQAFERPPEIGARWPRDGNYLPGADELMRELAKRTSSGVLSGLLDQSAAFALVMQPTPLEAMSFVLSPPDEGP